MTDKTYKIYVAVYEPGVTNHYGSFTVQRSGMDIAYDRAMKCIAETYKKDSLVRIIEIREVG